MPRFPKKIDLELAGMPSPLEQADRPRKLLIPSEIIIRGDRMIWSAGFMAAERLKPFDERRLRSDYVTRAPGPGLLEEFLALSDATSERILTYAKRWGVLSICKHGLPSCHRSGSALLGCLSLRARRENVYWEPLTVWRFFSRQARAILDVAAATHRSELASPEMLTLINDTPSWPASPAQAAKVRAALEEATRKLAEHYENLADERQVRRVKVTRDHRLKLSWQRDRLCAAVNRWLGEGFVRPALEWTTETPVIDLRAGSVQEDCLFGALALQLAYAVAATEGVATCSACGKIYRPHRRPAKGRRSFCRHCGIRAAWRISKSESRVKVNRHLHGKS